MSQLVALEINEHITAQKPVVKNQINIKMVFIKGKALLASLKKKTAIVLLFLTQQLYWLIPSNFSMYGTSATTQKDMVLKHSTAFPDRAITALV
jgi:hypothetical protein